MGGLFGLMESPVRCQTVLIPILGSSEEEGCLVRCREFVELCCEHTVLGMMVR